MWLPPNQQRGGYQPQMGRQSPTGSMQPQQGGGGGGSSFASPEAIARSNQQYSTWKQNQVPQQKSGGMFGSMGRAIGGFFSGRKPEAERAGTFGRQMMGMQPATGPLPRMNSWNMNNNPSMSMQPSMGQMPQMNRGGIGPSQPMGGMKPPMDWNSPQGIEDTKRSLGGMLNDTSGPQWDIYNQRKAAGEYGPQQQGGIGPSPNMMQGMQPPNQPPQGQMPDFINAGSQMMGQWNRGGGQPVNRGYGY